MRISTSWMYQQSVSSMLNQQSSLAATQNQVTTQKRINVASDDPAGAGQIVSLNHILAANTQYSSNIDSASNRLSTEQITLGSVASLLDNARSLALQGINGSLTSSDRQDMAAQLVQMRDSMVQLANTADANGNLLLTDQRCRQYLVHGYSGRQRTLRRHCRKQQHRYPRGRCEQRD